MNLTLLHEIKIPNYRSEKTARGVKKECLLPVVPSWNDVLSKEQWGRDKMKKEIANAFLSALRASESGCSTKIICAASTRSTYADTLESFLKIRLEQRKLRSRNARLRRAKKNTL